MDVVVLRWPEEASEIERLTIEGVPRLLLVAPDAPPPEGGKDCLLDWIRLPADDQDVRVRVAALEARAGRHLVRPELDSAGRLRDRGEWVSLSQAEAAVASVLIENFGSGVPADLLAEAGEARRASSLGALRLQIMHLRRRIAPLGLEIYTLRGRGYMLERARAPRY